MFTLVAAVLATPAARGQIAPDRGTPAQTGEPSYKYEVYAGFGYTSLNQVNQSRFGLIGVNVAVTRDWGKYFGLTADGAFYPTSLGSGNPGKPSVSVIMGGPVLRAPLIGNVNGFVHALLGGEHSGGERQTPSISLTGGFGGGFEYAMSPRFLIRASGDSILSSFSLVNNTPQLGYSPHMRANARATIGVVYRF